MHVLSETLGTGIEDRALKHLRNCIPDVCASMAEAELRHVIHWGRLRAQRHGVANQSDFFRYLNLMFMFGLEFDVNPKYPWAATALRSTLDSRPKMDLLMDHALLFCSRNESTPIE